MQPVHSEGQMPRSFETSASDSAQELVRLLISGTMDQLLHALDLGLAASPNSKRFLYMIQFEALNPPSLGIDQRMSLCHSAQWQMLRAWLEERHQEEKARLLGRAFKEGLRAPLPPISTTFLATHGTLGKCGEETYLAQKRRWIFCGYAVRHCSTCEARECCQSIAQPDTAFSIRKASLSAIYRLGRGSIPIT